MFDSERVMDHLLRVLAAAALLGAVACSEPCNTQAAKLKNSYSVTNPASCTLAPGRQATINLALCQDCTDSSPQCFQTLVSNDQLEISPVVEQCQGNATCEGSGCNIATPSATCVVPIPATPNQSISFVITGESGATSVPGVIEVQSGAGTTCNL